MSPKINHWFNGYYKPVLNLLASASFSIIRYLRLFMHLLSQPVPNEFTYDTIAAAFCVFLDGSADIASDLMPQITLTTKIAMDFNDRDASTESGLMTLPKSLSKLGETLASRFEMEDRLIDTMHESHREAVA